MASRSMSEARAKQPPCSSRAYTPEYKSYTIGDLSVDDYHRVSDMTMDTLTENLEALGDEIELEGMDVEYSSGVLTLKLGDKGTFVINKQPPNKQIWLSSPLSGPKRFDYDTGSKVWFYHRDGSTLDGLLNSELTQMLDRQVEVLAPIE